MTNGETVITRASLAKHYADATELILEYVEWLNFDLSFQNFDNEISSLPSMYNSHDGGLFIAYLNGQAVGVAGLRRFQEKDGELKRMFVKESARGHGIGRLLVTKCIETARELRYESLKLDTTADMKTAIRLYTDLGFVETPAYRYNPQEGARYYELAL